MNKNILMETNHSIHLTQVWICLFFSRNKHHEGLILIKINNSNLIWISKINSGMFCFRERFENVLNSIRFQSLPGLYDPTAGLESDRLVGRLGLARSATQQLKDWFRNLIRLGRHRRSGCKQNLIFGEFTHFSRHVWITQYRLGLGQIFAGYT